jgi:hypothetical protein
VTAYRQLKIPPYRILDLTHVDLDGILTVTTSRKDAEAVAKQHRLPRYTINRAYRRYGRVYVYQLDGDARTRTVTLATDDGGERTVELSIAPASYRSPAPLDAIETTLERIAEDYPAGTPTNALAEALAAVLLVWAARRRDGYATIDLRAIDHAIAGPLQALTQAWTDDDPTVH